MNKFIALTSILLACGSPQIPPSRALCYAQADVRAQARVNAECPNINPDAGVTFDQCPAHNDIMAQLQREQELCK